MLSISQRRSVGPVSPLYAIDAPFLSTMNADVSIVWLTVIARTPKPATSMRTSGFSTLYWIVGSFFDGMSVKSGQTSPLKKCRLRTSSVGGRADDEQRLAAVLRAVVGDGREVADVIEMRVADEHRLELVLQLEVETARQRAGVDRRDGRRG